MASTRTLEQRKTARSYGFKVLGDATAGEFEAVVSVFNNVDLGGDRILPGAFTDSLARWASSGDPIPVIFSHQWEDLASHVGKVLEARDLAPGDALLPPELRALGGLWVKGLMELDAPDPVGSFARALWAKMRDRLIREFSFAYDVIKAKPGANGATLDLIELDVIEVGPTLKGMNPLTALVDVKTRGGRDHVDPLAVLALADDLKADFVDDLDAAVARHPSAGAWNTATSSASVFEAKRLPRTATPGAVEDTLAIVFDAANVWAELHYGRDLYVTHLEATFLADERAIITAERWEDPFGEGPVWALDYTLNADGTATIGDAVELEVTVSLAAKRSERAARARQILQGKAEASRKAETGDPTPISGAPARTLVDADLIEAELNT